MMPPTSRASKLTLFTSTISMLMPKGRARVATQHGSGSSLNVTTFKSNLMAHLQRRGSGNFDPGVEDGSSSEYSEYDD